MSDSNEGAGEEPGRDGGRIRVRGASQHNLRRVDLDLPRGLLIAFTGVSGSGKSSMAFDTLFAEGQRRYVESLAAGLRPFVGVMERPAFEQLVGLPPTIAVDQRAPSPGPRSTVGTMTEAHDLLRALFGRLGVAHCPDCGRSVDARSAEEVAAAVLGGEAAAAPLEAEREGAGEAGGRAPEGARFQVLAPQPTGLDPAELLRALRGGGFVRLRLDGEVRALADLDADAIAGAERIELVVDRLVVREGMEDRLVDSVETAYRHGDGTVALDFPGRDGRPGFQWRFSERHHCAHCDRELPEPSPTLLSFNDPRGMCPECRGIGVAAGEGAPRAAGAPPCPACGGSRLRPEARAVTFAGRGIVELLEASARTLRELLGTLRLPPGRTRAAADALAELDRRLALLDELGVGHLTLGRAADGLSAGEQQRVRLASQLGNELSGVLYVLDEPTHGLHPRDRRRLLRTLERLRALGNSVLVVEHDPEVIRAAAHVVDFGPGAGAEGGTVIAQGTLEAVIASEASVTGAYLGGRRRLQPPARRRAGGGTLVVRGARAHNLANVDVRLPLGTLTAVTGVSGAGKSSLVDGILRPALRRLLHGASEEPGEHDGLEGTEALARLVEVDARPIGRSPRSNPATWTKIFDEIRRLFAATREARARGFGAGRFSFNHARGGRCERCRGEGAVRVELQLLPDVWVTCEECGGTRFDEVTRRVRWHGLSIDRVLELTVDEALEIFTAQARIRRVLQSLHDVGLGYLRLGQPAHALSGGEAQRLKLGRELARSLGDAPGGSGRPAGEGRGGGERDAPPASGTRTLHLLDEPTAGLHPSDVERLLAVLDRLVDAGHTVVMVEHRPEVVAAADHVVDLGPEAGEGGGRVVASGTPEEVARAPESWTGRYLEPVLRGGVASTADGAPGAS